jgi:hypothetical protein
MLEMKSGENKSLNLLLYKNETLGGNKIKLSAMEELAM